MWEEASAVDVGVALAEEGGFQGGRVAGDLGAAVDVVVVDGDLACGGEGVGLPGELCQLVVAEVEIDDGGYQGGEVPGELGYPVVRQVEVRERVDLEDVGDVLDRVAGEVEVLEARQPRDVERDGRNAVVRETQLLQLGEREKGPRDLAKLVAVAVEVLEVLELAEVGEVLHAVVRAVQRLQRAELADAERERLEPVERDVELAEDPEVVHLLGKLPEVVVREVQDLQLLPQRGDLCRNREKVILRKAQDPY